MNAIRAGAKEYIPLPPDAELIAAVIAAVARESQRLPVPRSRRWRASSSSPSRSPRSDASASSSPARAAPARRSWRSTSTAARKRAGQAFHLDQLRRDSRSSARERALRPREGRLHRRRRPPHRQVRGSHRRHAAARRNLRDGCPPPGEAPARHPGARDRPRRRHPAGARSTSASSPPRTATSPRRSAPAPSARTCCSASTSST